MPLTDYRSLGGCAFSLIGSWVRRLILELARRKRLSGPVIRALCMRVRCGGTTRKEWAPPHIYLGKRLEDRDGLLRFGAHRVIGIRLGVPDDAAAVDHEACRQRQLPRGVAVPLREVVLESVEV